MIKLTYPNILNDTAMNCLKCLSKFDQTEAHYGLHPQCFMEWFEQLHCIPFDSLQQRSPSSSDPAISSIAHRSFFHGKFRKYSAKLGTESYILKMRQKEAPEIPEVEYLCNQIANSIGLPVANFYYINFHGDHCFVTKNFIKPGSPADLQHIYHHRPDDQHNCEKIIQTIIEKTQRPYDVKIFIQTLIFDALIGNHDRHGRNLAFITTANRTNLSPIYDNVSYLSLESGEMLKANFSPSGRISTSKSHEPGMREYVQELKKLGHQNILAEINKNINFSYIDHLIDKSFCSLLMKDAIKTLFKKRYEEFVDEL